MKRILIVGYKGFIGSNLKKLLESNNYEILNFSRGDDLKWGCICHADLVINCAGEVKDESKMIQDNLIFALNLAEACKVFNKRLIHVGTMYEDYGSGLYKETKLASSKIIRNILPNFVHIKSAIVYGNDNNKKSFLNTLWNKSVLKEPLDFIYSERDWIHINDLCNAILYIVKYIDNLSVLEFEIGYGRCISNEYIVSLFEKYIGSYIILNKIGAQHRFACNINDIKSLGWIPSIQIEDGIRQFVDYKFLQNSKDEVFLGAEA